MKRMHDKKQLGGGVTEEQFEDLVRATPTDIRAVVDQGQIQLQLEHDGNVLSIDENLAPIIQGIHGAASKTEYFAYLSLILISVSATYNGNSAYSLDITLDGIGRTSNIISSSAPESMAQELINTGFNGAILVDILKNDGTHIYYGMATVYTSIDGEINIYWKDSSGNQHSVFIQGISNIDECMDGISFFALGSSNQLIY